MIIKELHLLNFGPYRGTDEAPQTLTFPTDEQRNVMVVFGDNERGKTSLLNAIRWVLYGSAIDRYNNEIPVHLLFNREAARDGEKKMSVSLEFEAASEAYELKRTATIRRLVANPKSPDDLEISVHLKRNGEVVKGDSIEGIVNNLIPEATSRFYLFDGELLTEYQMLLQDASEKSIEIQRSIENILGLPALTNGRDELTVLQKKAEKRYLTELKRNDQARSSAERSLELQALIARQEDDVKALNEKIREQKVRIAEIDRSLEATEGVRSIIDALHRSRQELEALSEARQTQTIEQHRLLEGAWKDLLQPLVKLKRAEAEAELANEKARDIMFGGDVARLKLLTELQNEHCPLCDGEISEARRRQYAREQGELKVKIEMAEQARRDTTEPASLLMSLSQIDPTGALGSLAQLQKQRRRGDVQTQIHESKIAQYEQKLRGHDTEAIAHLQGERDERLLLVGRFSESVSALEAARAKLESEYETLKRMMGRYADNTRQRSQAQAEMLEELVNVFDSSVGRLRDELRGTVERHASEIFLRLTNEPDYKGLSINEMYGLSILDHLGQEKPLRSAGAEQVVALSLLSALNRSASRSGPVIMDTPFGRLDLRHREKIVEFIPSMAKQVIFLVHEGEIAREDGLASIADRIGAQIEIKRVSGEHSRLATARN